MTTGKIMATILVLSGLLAGFGMYYLQVYGFYEEIDASEAALQVTMVDGRAVPLAVDGFRGIDADSSPLRFRGCMMVDPATLATAQPYTVATPLVGPRWFDCFSARDLTQDLASGAATAYLGQRNIHPGFDRVIAVYPDGRAYSWHQANETAEEKKVIE